MNSDVRHLSFTTWPCERNEHPEPPKPRAKAYVVTPYISPILRREFEDQNFVVLEAEAEEFFRLTKR